MELGQFWLISILILSLLFLGVFRAEFTSFDETHQLKNNQKQVQLNFLNTISFQLMKIISWKTVWNDIVGYEKMSIGKTQNIYPTTFWCFLSKDPW